MTTSWTDEELEQKIADGHHFHHSLINPGETMTVMIPHKGVDAHDEPSAKDQADHVLIYFRDDKPVWKRVQWRGKKTIVLGNGTSIETDDYDYGAAE